jgi:hypothetical protein
MKPLLKNLVVTATVLVATGAVALPAFARSLGAYAGGRSAFPGDAACFSESWGAAVNNCNTMKSYEISLPVDSIGYKHVWVSAYGANATSNVSCRAIGESPDLLTTWATGFTPLPAYGSSQTIDLTGAYVTSGGALFAYCHVDPGGRINSVAFEY